MADKVTDEELLEKLRGRVDRGRRAKWWRRRGDTDEGFSYVDAKEKKIRKKDEIERVNSLAIPPAWRCVRICPSPNGKLQAVGVDDAERLQYIYHESFRRKREREKFAKIERFGTQLPKLRELTNEHIRLDGFPREKVLAMMTRLVNHLYMRVGTESSKKKHRTYGITTLEKRHLSINGGSELVFDFVGKSHVKHRKVLVDDDLAAEMKRLRKIGGGRKLFNYKNDEGKIRPVRPQDLNRYLKEATADEFSMKDLRTWGATLLAAIELAEEGVPRLKAERRKTAIKVIGSVAERLGNTPAVCEASYIHPAVLKAFTSGVTIDKFRPRSQRKVQRIEESHDLEERALKRLFDEYGFA